LAGLLGLFLTVDELEKLSVVYPYSRTIGIAGNGAIRTKDKSIINHAAIERYSNRLEDI
jgi:hypothetical protein